MSVNRTFSDQETAQDLSVFGGDSSVVWWPFAATDWVAADGWDGQSRFLYTDSLRLGSESNGIFYFHLKTQCDTSSPNKETHFLNDLLLRFPLKSDWNQ